jgi:electron transfer flavoprotein alpha subunit
VSAGGDSAGGADRLGATAPGAPTLLVVVEPPVGGGGDAAAAAARIALAAEATRLAAALGAELHVVSWAPAADTDFASLAVSVAEVARSAGSVAVLLQDGDAGRELAPLVAQRLGTCAVLSCSDARVGRRDSAGPLGPASPPGLTFVKQVYGGWLEQEVVAADGFVPVATLDLAGLEPAEDAAAQAAAVLARAHAIACAPEAFPRVRHLETVPPDARSVDLVHAKRIVAAGMGAANEDLLAAVRELADLLEGSVGATRPMVDEGRLSKERLIGQTGRTVAPDLYVALGISGSPHHVAGVRKAERVLSINRDVRAPIFQFSDVGYVADLQAVLPALIEKIKAWRDAPAGDGAPAGSGDGR